MRLVWYLHELKIPDAVYELKDSVTDYLGSANVDDIHSVEELIDFNIKHAADELPESE